MLLPAVLDKGADQTALQFTSFVLFGAVNRSTVAAHMHKLASVPLKVHKGQPEPLHFGSRPRKFRVTNPQRFDLFRICRLHLKACLTTALYWRV